MRARRRLERLHRRVLAGIDRLRELAADGSRLARERPELSAWSVGDHVEHLAVSDELILQGLAAVLDASPRGEATEVGPTRLVGRLLLALGWIPRGRAQAPPAARPRGADADELRSRLGELRHGFAGLGERLGELAASRRRLPHPVFGGLTARQWLRFVEIHHRHHGKIIAEIERG